MKRTNIVDPWELKNFALEKYNLDDRAASDLIWWVTPECEVKTLNYHLAEVQEELQEIEAEYSDKTNLDYLQSKQINTLLIDFMIDNKITEFTLTQ